MEIKRGQIWYTDLTPVVGSEQGGFRPVLIISNDIGNAHSPVVIAAPITTKISKKKLPTQVIVKGCGLISESMIMCEQIRTIDKTRIKGYVGTLTATYQAEVNKAIKISLGV